MNVSRGCLAEREGDSRSGPYAREHEQGDALHLDERGGRAEDVRKVQSRVECDVRRCCEEGDSNRCEWLQEEERG